MFGKRLLLAGFLFLLTTMGLAQTAPSVSYSDDFQSYGTPSNPPGWVDTSVGNPKPTAAGLYKTWSDPLQGNHGANVVYGTKQSSGKPEGNNPRIGTFSTLTTKTFSAKGGFQFRGRFIRTTTDARIGLSFFSSYPELDKYYLIGLWSKPSDPTRLTLQLFGFGAGTPSGTVDSDISLDPNKWYQFYIQVDDVANATKIHARFWLDGTTEPTTFSIDATDNAAARLTSGRIGMWAAVRGDAYIDDLNIRSSFDNTPPVITFADAATQTVLDPATLALFKTPARIEIRVTDDSPNPTYTAKLDTTTDYVSATPIAVDGLHAIKVHAVDGSGNLSDATLNLLVDQHPPVVTLQIDGAPFTDGAIFNHDVTLSALIQDISQLHTVSILDGNTVTLPVPVADEKAHQIQVTATDQVGWETSAAEGFIVDKTAPVIEIKANGATMNGGESFAANVTLTWIATDLTLNQVTATLDGNPITSGSVVSAEGLHTLVVTATDRAGHTKTETRSFALDKTAPEVHLLANGQPFVAGTTFKLPVTFTAQIQSATPTTKVATIDDQPYTLGNAYGVEGNHSIKLVVTNATNLSTTVGPFPFTIDLTNPTVALTESGEAFHDGMKFARDVNPVVTATDNLTAAPERTLFLDGNVYPLDTPISEEQVDHTISATAKDAGGNTATVGPFHFMLDKTKPVVTIVEAEGGKAFLPDALFNRAVSVKITVADLTHTTLVATVDGAPLTLGAPTTQPDGSVLYVSAPITGDATHTISAVATDEVGNKNDAVTASFTIDTTPPQLTFTSHHDGDVVTTPQIVVSGTSDDAQSGTVNDIVAAVDTTAKTFTSATLSLVEGKNVITAKGTDKAGNNGSASISIYLDTRAPEIAIALPVADACLDAATLAISGTAADPRIAAVTVAVGTAAAVPTTLDAAHGTWSASIPVTEGKQLITVVATDTAGHSSTVTRNVVIDSTAPVIDIRESGASFTATLLNRAVTLLVRADDADPNVAFTARLDGAAYANGAAIGEGAHQLVVSATDCAGHHTDKTIAFTIDLTPPAIRNLNPGNGATVGTTPSAISGNTDTDAARVEIVGSPLAATPNADGSFTIAAVPFADGVNRFTLKATDRAGNSSETAYAVTVHTTTPVVSITEGGSVLVGGTLFNRAVTPEIKSSDSAATIAATLNGSPFVSGTTVTADGNYSLGATATDAQNHVGHADTTFVIDRTPPVVKITSPVAGIVTSDHVEVRGTAGDAVSAAVNGIAVTLAADGSFVLPSLPLDFGATTPIIATARDRAGNTGRDEVDVTPADSRPGIVLTYPPDHSLTNRPATEVLGRTLSTPPDGVVTIGTTSVPVDPSGAFRLSGYTLIEGDNTITASVKNRNGSTNSATVHVTGDFTPPSLTILESGQPLVDDARFATQAVLTLTAADSGSGGVTTELTVDGAKVTTLPVTVTLNGGHSASATARDAAGNESHADRTFFIGTSTGTVGCALSDFDPKDGSIVLSSTATLVGRSGGAIGVKVNGVAAAVADGSFRATVELPNEGANIVTIACTDGSGNPTGTPVTITLNRITGDPSISIDTPAEGFATGSDTIAVTGTVGPGVIGADVNGATATITGNDVSVSRPFIVANLRLAAGLNVLAAHGKNGAGRIATASRRVFLLKELPIISVSSPLSGISTGSASVTVSGTWTNLDPATIVITNLASGLTVPSPGIATSDTTGTFNASSVALIPGEQTLKVSGRDKLNREATESVTIKLIAGTPSVSITQPLDHSYFGPSAGTTFAVSGSFQGAAGSTVDVNGSAATLSGATYSANVPFATGAGGLTPVVARVTEPGGASGVAAIVVTKLSAAPKVIESFPAPNAVEVDPGALLLVLFSAPMDRASLAGGAFRLEDASGATVSGTLFLEKDVVTFAPAALLTRGSHYTIRVTVAAKDVAATALESEYVAGFTVGTSAPSTPPSVTPVAAAFCGQIVTIKGTAPAGSRVQAESGSITIPGTADAQGNFTISYPLSGQSGYATVRVRIVGSDGSLSPAAELTFRVDCVGPQVLNATYERTGANRIAIVFSESIDPASATVAADGAIYMTLSDGRIVGGTASVSGSTVTVAPAEDLSAKSFTLNVTTVVRDTIGNRLTAPYTQNFSISNEQPPAGDGTGFISGEVYDATTGRPLPGAAITIEVPATAFAKTATQSLKSSTTQSLKPSTLSVSTNTDGRGRYLVRLPEGAHTIRATMNGYTSVWRQIIVAAGAGVIPIDVRLTKVGDTKTSTGAALTLTHGGETTITRKVTLSIPGGVVASGKSVSLTAVGGQALTGLLPLGWSPVSSAEVVAESLTSAQLIFTVPASEVSAAAQNLSAVRYDELRDTWQVLTPVVNVASDGTASVAINAPGAYALVYPDKAPGLAQPALAAAGAPLAGVAAPATDTPLTSRSFHLDPSVVLPNGRTVATLNIEGLGGATFPSGTAVQAYIDEELKLADGSTLLDPPFATDLLLYRSLNGETGVSDFHLAPSPRAAQVILEVGFDHIRVVPYPGRLDRGTLVGAEGGRVPADDKVAIELPTGATPEPLRATASSLTQADLDAVGSIAGFHILGGFNVSLQRATQPPPQDLDGDGKPDAVPPVELFKAARATFTVDGSKLPSPTSSLILVELLDATPYGKMVRLAAQMMPIDPVNAGSTARFTTRNIDRSLLPVDGVIREGRYLLLAADAPIAYATGSVHLGIGGSLLANARVSANALGVADLTRVTGIYNVPVVAAPAAPFTLTPRHVATGDGASYTHGSSAVAESVNKIDLNLVPQPPALTAVTVFGADASQLALSESTITPNVALTTNVRAAFSPAIDATSVEDTSIIVVDAISGATVDGKATGDATGVTWSITPGQRLKNNNRYSVTISPLIRGTNGASLGKSVTYSFNTVVQVSSTDVHADRIGITIPDANGVSRVFGIAGALPAGWQAVTVRRNIDFITRYQATASADGSFSFTIGNGGDAVDKVKISDLIDLQVINSAGNIAAIIPLTPFVTEDHRGFVAPSNIDVKFTSADGIAVSIAAGTFDQPTIVNVVATTQSAVADVPHLDQDVEYATSVRLDFDGIAHKPMEVELPVPAGFDTNGKNFILGYRGNSIRGPRVMAVDTLRIVDGKFSTTLDPTQNLRVSVLSNGARTGSQQVLTGKDLKNYLMRVQRSGIYAVVDIRVPVGGGVGWAVMDGLQAGYDLFWDTLASFYAADFYLFEGHGRVVVPVITGKPFTVVGVDSSTGLQGFSKVYDPIPVGDPNVAVTIASPLQNTGGPYPIFAIPFRTELLELNAAGIDIDAIRNFKVKLDNDQVTVRPGSDPLPTDTKVTLLDISNGGYATGTAGQTLTLAAKLGHRIVLLIEQKEVDPSSVLTLTFNEPIYVTGNDEDAISAFLQTQLKLENADEPPTGTTGNPTYSDITSQGHYTLDSGGRRLKIELPSSLKREAIYRLTLKKDIADRSGSGGAPGMKLGQGAENQNGTLVAVGGGNDLELLFHVRKPGGKLATFDIASGFVRDIALNGNVLLVTSSSGSDGTGAALMAYDVADPASLNTASGGTAPVPLAKVTTTTNSSFWAVASDPHGRVYVTEQGPVLGSLRSYRLEDLVAANGLTVPQKSGAVTNWALGYSSSIGLLSNTILSDRPESIPRKLQILLQDDDKVYNGRDAFKNATGATEATINGSDVKKYSLSVPFDSNNPYLMQRVTVENLTLDMRWSADASPSGPASIQNIIALPTDRIKVSKNQRTYGVISHMGYGVGVYDLNAMESNDAPNRPSTYKALQEQIVLSPGKNDDACFQPNTTTPKPPDYAIQEIYLSAEAAIRTDASAPNEIRVYAPDPYRGLLDMRFTPDKVQNNPDAAITPTECQTRAPIGLILRATDPSANHPRVQALMNAFQSQAGRSPFIHFISVSPYSWRREAQDNAKGVRGSTPNAAVSRDYLLLAGGDLGVIVVEVGGSPAPNLPSYPPYWPLKNEHVADVIWVPGGAVAVRTIPRTNLAVIVDRSGRVLLADLSRLDERFDANGNPIPGTPLFATVAKCLSLPTTDPDGVGAYDPRIIWKSEKGIIAGSLPPVVDGDTGMLYAGELLRKALKVVAALDPQIQMKVDIGEETGLSAVGGVVPLGIAPPKSITDKIDALPACTSGGTARCKENASLGAFRLELTLPGGMVDALTQSNQQLQLAVESERVFNAVSEQTPDGFPRSHLRRFKRDGSAEDPVRVATNFKMQRVVPNDPALEKALRRQRGFNKFISPWIVALDDPRASSQYNWNGATADQKKDAGCEYCSRPQYLDGKTEADGVYELWTNGRLIAVRPEFISSSGGSTTPDSIFANTPYEYLGKEDRLVTRFATIIADTVRPTEALVAGQSPAMAGGSLLENVYLHSGEVETSHEDLNAGGRAGFDVAFDRNYHSRTMGGTFIGQGWEASMFRRLRALPNGDVEFRDGGDVWRFKSNTNNGGYDSPKGLFLRLARNGSGWTITDQKWRVTAFDELGRLSFETDEFANPAQVAAGTGKGNVVRYLYDDTGRLRQVLDPVQRSSELTYWKDSEANQTGAYAGLLKEIKDWRDRKIDFEYDSATSTLKSVKLPEVANTDNVRPEIKYAYKQGASNYNDKVELSGDLETITDPAATQFRVKFEYGTSGLERDRLKTETWGTNETATFTYNSATDVETKDALGQTRKYTLSEQAKDYFKDRAHIKKIVETQVPTSTTPFGELPSTFSASIPATAPVDRTFDFDEYDDEGLLKAFRLEGVRSVSQGYKNVQPEAPGFVLEKTTITPLAGPADPIERTLGYQSGGNASTFLQSVTAKSGANAALAIDAPETHQGTTTVTATNNQIQSTVEVNDFGQVKEVKGANGTDSTGAGADTSIDYHPADSADKFKRSLPKSINQGSGVTTAIDYPTQDQTKETDARNVVTLTDYDTWGRTIHTNTTDGGGTLVIDERTEYDAAGHVKKRIQKQKNTDVTTTYGYDIMGRRTSATTDNIATVGSVTTGTVYDIANHTITINHPGGSATTTTLDSLGRTVHAQTTTGASPIDDYFAYDLAGNRVFQTDLLTATATAYDAHNRAVQSMYPDGTKSKTDFDAWGHETKLEEKDAAGAVTGQSTYDYEAGGKLKSQNTKVDGSRTRTMNFAWDGGGRTTGASETGRAAHAKFDTAGRLVTRQVGAGDVTNVNTVFEKTEVTGNTGALPQSLTKSEKSGGSYGISLEYNTAGDVTSNKLGNLEWKQELDQAGNTTSMKLPNRPATTYNFDSRGAIKSRTLPGGAEHKYDYHASGAPTNYTDPSSEVTQTDTDLLGRPTKRTYVDGTKEIVVWEGRRLHSITDRQGRYQQFVYNDKGQLTEIDGPGNVALEKIAYDDAGHITKRTTDDAVIEFSDFDLDGNPHKSMQSRYAGGTLIDQYAQEHEWDEHGDRFKWTMPSYAALSPGSRWTASVKQDRDAMRNVIHIEKTPFGGSASTLLDADYRNAGRPDLRTITTAAGTSIVRKYDYDGNSLPSHMDVKANGLTVAGSDVKYDGVQKQRADLLGVSGGKRANTWGYDDRSRLKTSTFAREQGAAPFTDDMTVADFRSSLERPQTSPGDPPTINFTEGPGHKITGIVRGTSSETVTFNGGERSGDGRYAYAYDGLGRLSLVTEKPVSIGSIRRFHYYYDGNGRMVGRRAEYAPVSTAGTMPLPADWKLEDRPEFLSADTLPADTTFVWDPVSDNLVAVFKAGSSQTPNIDDNGGLLRQYIHGGKKYDDPIEVTSYDITSSLNVGHYYPIYDEAGSASLQVILNETGQIVGRNVPGGPYNEDESILLAAAVDKIGVHAKKDAQGNVDTVEVTLRTTEQIAGTSLGTGVRLAVVDANGKLIRVASNAPRLADEFDARWTLTASEWTALVDTTPVTVGGATLTPQALSVAATASLRAAAWNANLPVMPAPAWATASQPVYTSGSLPVEVRDSLANLSQWLASIGSSDEKTETLYEVPSLLAIGAPRVFGGSSQTLTGDPQRLILVAGFHAQPFQDPATGLNYVRARWFDSQTATWLTPDPSGYRDSANLYAYAGGDPVNYGDPLGEAQQPEGLTYTIEGWVNGQHIVYTGSGKLPTRIEEVHDSKLLREIFGTEDKSKVSQEMWDEFIKRRSTRIRQSTTEADLALRKEGVSENRAGNRARRAPEEVERARISKEIEAHPEAGVREANSIKASRNPSAAMEELNVKPGEFKVTKPGLKGLGYVAGAVVDVYQAYDMARDLHIEEQGIRSAAIRFHDEGGEFEIWDDGIILNCYFKHYFSGPKQGQNVRISWSEKRALQKKYEDDNGYLDWKGDFVPGKLRKELPIVCPTCA